MAIVKRIKPNIRILIVFFAAILVIAIVQVGVFSLLFNAMGKEERAVNQERTNSAALKLDVAINEVCGKYSDMLRQEHFAAFSGLRLTETELLGLYQDVSSTLDSSGYIREWAVFLKGTEQIVTKSGIMASGNYASRYCRAEGYDTSFWMDLNQRSFIRLYFPETEFAIMNTQGNYDQIRLLPVAMRSYYDNNSLAVVMLDMRHVLDDTEPYLQSGIYMFSPEGTLIYTNDTTPNIAAIPAGESVKGADGNAYEVYAAGGKDGITYVKLLPESQATEVLRGSMILSLGALAAAMIIATVLMLPAVRSTFHPVNSMIELLQQHSQLENTNDLHGAHEELQQILKSREQQAADLAQKNAALSEYILHSRLKNVYVDMEQPEQPEESCAYILYIQVQYRETMRGYFSMTRAELENCLQEMLSATLNRLFDTTLIFQLEPGRFAAKVTLPHPETKMGDRMERFMQRLDNEKEFVSFTVVQSEPLDSGEDLAAVYNQVQTAARQAVVCDQSQLLELPVEQAAGVEYVYPRAQEQKLYACVQEGRTDDAVATARDAIEENLKLGISHAQMEVLCVALVNTASYAITELAPSAEKIAAASGVYNTLTSKCITSRDYIDAVVGFIRTAAAASDVQQTEEDQLLRKVQQYLKENYQREFSGEELANALWVSRSYLSSYYKSKTGMNLSDSIQMFRIQKAVELLKDPTVRIGDIGPMVGIPSTNTFLRQFKKYTGMTPKEYRQKETE